MLCTIRLRLGSARGSREAAVRELFVVVVLGRTTTQHLYWVRAKNLQRICRAKIETRLVDRSLYTSSDNQVVLLSAAICP